MRRECANIRATASARGKSLGTAACTAIVVGNMVGSGFYLSPTAVAPYGNLAIVAWIVMGIGAMCLGLTFAKLADSHLPLEDLTPTPAWLTAISQAS